MKWLLMITITCLTLTLGLAAGRGGPADTTTATPSPFVVPAPISSPPTHSTTKADTAPESRLRRTSTSVGNCVFLYSPETVRDRAFAFDGTVESV